MFQKLARCFDHFGMSPHKLKDTKLYHYFGDHLFKSDLWEFTPRSVARAWLISIFSAGSPFLGLHMLMSVAGAIIFRANLPISAALVWINNPVTMLAYYPFAYWFGCKITHQGLLPHIHWHYALTHGFETIRLLFIRIWEPLLIGCTVLGLLFGLFGYILILFLGRLAESHKKKLS